MTKESRCSGVLCVVEGAALLVEPSGCAPLHLCVGTAVPVPTNAGLWDKIVSSPFSALNPHPQAHSLCIATIRPPSSSSKLVPVFQPHS